MVDPGVRAWEGMALQCSIGERPDRKNYDQVMSTRGGTLPDRNTVLMRCNVKSVRFHFMESLSWALVRVAVVAG
jgi:hypothetical protein